MNVSFLVTDECFGRPEGFKHTEVLQRCMWRGIGGQMGQRLVGLHREMEQCTQLMAPNNFLFSVGSQGG